MFKKKKFKFPDDYKVYFLMLKEGIALMPASDLHSSLCILLATLSKLEKTCIESQIVKSDLEWEAGSHLTCAEQNTSSRCNML